jgi:hypothetical protein
VAPLVEVLERIGDLGRSVVARRKPKPCDGTLAGISNWAILGCEGDAFDLRGWTTVTVPDGWVALDANRHDIKAATSRWLLPVGGLHFPVVLFSQIEQRRDGIAKVLISKCPSRTADHLVSGLPKAADALPAHGRDLTVDRIEVGGLPTDRFVLRYPEVFYAGTLRGSTLAAVWATYTPDGAFVVQADFPNFDENDERAVATFLWTEPSPYAEDRVTLPDAD